MQTHVCVYNSMRLLADLFPHLTPWIMNVNYSELDALCFLLIFQNLLPVTGFLI